MKTTTLFIIAVLACSTLALNNNLSINNKFKQLQKTGWGKVATSFIDLQLQLGGPIDEMIQAFINLLADLNFQVEMEQMEFKLKTADHNDIHASIQGRIDVATANIAEATHKIDNILIPLQKDLVGRITRDETLVADTTAALENAEQERHAENGKYKDNVDEHEAAIQAIGECIDLIRELDNDGEFSLIQVQKAQNHLKKLQQRLNYRSEWSEMIKVMITIAQNFSNQGAVDKVLGMLNTVLGETHTSLEQAHDDERDSLASYNVFVEDSTLTLNQANARLVENRAALEAAKNEEANQRDFRDTQTANLETANGDMEAETNRWTNEVNTHDALMAALKDELSAVDDIIEIVSAVNVSDELGDRLNQ